MRAEWGEHSFFRLMVVITHVNNTITPTLRIHACKVGGATGPDVAVDRVAAFSKYADEVGALCCVDANAGWTEADAMVFAAGVQPYAKYCLFLEQPLPPSGEGATLLHALRATCCLATPEHTHTHTHTHTQNQSRHLLAFAPPSGRFFSSPTSQWSLSRTVQRLRLLAPYVPPIPVAYSALCIIMHVCVPMRIVTRFRRLHLCIPAHKRAHTSAHHKHTHSLTHTHTQTQTQTQTHAHVHAHAHTHSHSHARTHARAHTHTHTGGRLLNQVLQGGWYHSHTSPSTPC
jgi:hypothetical protein